MPILNFMPRFVTTAQKKLLELEDRNEEQNAAVASDGWASDIFDYIDEAFDWTPAPPPESAFTPVEEEGIGSAIADFGFDDYNLENTIGGPVEEWGWENGAQEDWWVTNQDFTQPASGIGDEFGSALGYGMAQPIGSWFYPEDTSAAPPAFGDERWYPEQSDIYPPPSSFPIPQNDWGLPAGWDQNRFNVPEQSDIYPQVLDEFLPENDSPLWEFAGIPQAAPQGFGDDFKSGFAQNIRDLHVEDDPWADVVDMRSTPLNWGDRLRSALQSGPPTDSLLEQPEADWQLPDFGSSFRNIAESALGPVQDFEPVDYGLSMDWSADPENWDYTPTDYNLNPNWSMHAPYEWLTGGNNADDFASLSPDEQANILYESGLTNDDIPQEQMTGFSPEWQQRISDYTPFAGNALTEVGGGLWDTANTLNANVFEPIGDAFVDPLLQPLDSTGNRWSPLQKDFWSEGPSLNVNLKGDPENIDFAAPLEDTVANAREASDPWDFATKQEEEFSDRPFLQQVALQALGPGNGLWSNIDNLPQWATILDDVADTAQGGKLLGALGEIPGAGSFARNVLVPGAVGGGAGAASDIIFDPSYTDPLTGETIDPSFWESVALGVPTGILGNQALSRGLVPGQGIRDASGEFILPTNLKNAKPGTAFKDKNFALTFKDDLDKALYIVAGSKPSPKDGEYMDALRGFMPEMTDDQIRTEGRKVRKQITAIAKDAEVPAGEKRGLIEVAPIYRGVDEEVPAYLNSWQATIDDLSGNPVAAADTIPSIGTRSLPEPTALDPIAETIDDIDEVTFAAPAKAAQPELQDLLDKVNLQREWLATTDRIARRKGWYQESQRLYDVAYEDAIRRGASSTDAARIGRGAQKGFNQKNGLESLTISPEVKNAMTDRVNMLLGEGRLSPDKRSMVSRVMDTWSAGKSPSESELREFYRIITGADPSEKVISRFAGENIPGSRKAISETVDEIANAPLTPEEQVTIGSMDDVIDAKRKTRAKKAPTTAQEVADDAAEEFNDQTLLMQADVDEWLRLNRPTFDAVKWQQQTSLGNRVVGGSLDDQLADTLTQRARNLEQRLTEKRGIDRVEARDITNEAIGRYLDDRRLTDIEKGTPAEIADGMLEHALTALRYGDFAPEDAAGVIKIDPKTGEAAPLFKNLQSANSQMKNQMYGIADASVLHGNVLPAITAGWQPLAIGYLNRIANALKTGLDIKDASRAGDLAGLMGKHAQDATAPEKGTLAFSGTANVLDAIKSGNSLSKGLRAVDRPFSKWNEFLTKKQFDDILYKTFRKPIYEGNLVLLKATGNDINDADVRRAAARMANAVTSAAPMASGNNRRAIEGSLLNTAQFTRGQGDLLLTAAKLFSLSRKTSRAERTVGLSTIASIMTAVYGAHELAGLEFEIDPTDPDFGNVRLPDGSVLNIFPQKQLAKVIIETGDFLRTKNPDDLYQSWAQFLLGRAGPLVNLGAKTMDIGFDPNGETPGWNYPGMFGLDGKGDGWGSDATTFEKAVGILPFPTALTQTVLPLRDGEIGPATAALNTAGANTYPESELDKAKQAEGLEDVDDLRAYFAEKYPKSSESKLREFYKKYPEARGGDALIKEYAAEKAAESERFEDGDMDVEAWRDEMKRINQERAGVYNAKTYEGGKRPTEDGSAQWIYDYNQIYEKAKRNPGSSASGTDYDKLQELQAEFWKKHDSPAERKEIYAYQLATATTDAERMYIEDMAKLNGFNPKTGKALTWGEERGKMPNYFTMEKYESTEMKNAEAKEFEEKFIEWKDDLDKDHPYRKMENAKLKEKFIDEEQHVRPSGKPWSAASVQDAKNYGLKSKWTDQYSTYREVMAPELLWFDRDRKWRSIENEHDQR